MSYQQETRILKPSLRSASYAFVTMPKTAWYWLDDMVKTKFPKGGYKALMREFGATAACPESLADSLKSAAQTYGDSRMASLYNLANDNAAPSLKNRAVRAPSSLPRENPDLSARMPSCYRLFHFMPHATYLTTVWERKNFASRPTYGQ